MRQYTYADLIANYGHSTVMLMPMVVISLPPIDTEPDEDQPLARVRRETWAPTKVLVAVAFSIACWPRKVMAPCSDVAGGIQASGNLDACSADATGGLGWRISD